MYIIPAIDIKEGRCVRLLKGDFQQSKVYHEDPVSAARTFEEAGARLIHVVDLDGARTGQPANFDVIKKIRQAVRTDLEVGGGIRTKESIQRYLDAGIKRIILGTSIAEDVGFFDKIREYISSVIISLDLKHGKLSTRGWLRETGINYRDFIRTMLKQGVREAVITDISRDGTLEGPNIGLYKEIAETFPDLEVIVSGGMSRLADVEQVLSLKKKNIKGIIIGKAIYEKKINLKDALLLAATSGIEGERDCPGR
ncbi:MAG: 1-(5-phosphoribosyl)-5-[(5-phosphoribosylamino)methylideneamino]imidazole-4-carboxamide isomerase [bacterium]|nr:1-(5-phosphoribosyl)-5-[(5-phosphoribosylamino)methylideneamino]imidazole-4-carboxamide isomerase [bacterium]